MHWFALMRFQYVHKTFDTSEYPAQYWRYAKAHPNESQQGWTGKESDSICESDLVSVRFRNSELELDLR